MSEPKQEEDDFPTVQAEIEDTIKDLRDNEKAGPKLAQFREEYEKLFSAYSKCHESEVKLQKRTRELAGEIQGNQEKIQQAETESSEAQQSKKRLQSDIQSTWSQVSDSHKREAEKRSKSNEIKQAIQELSDQLNSGSGWSEDQEKAMKDLQKQRDDLAREIDGKEAVLQAVKTEVNHLFAMKEAEETANSDLQADINKLKLEVSSKQSQAEKEQRRKDRLDKELKALKIRVESAQEELDEKSGRIREGEHSIVNMEAKLREAKSQMEKYLREYDSLFRRTHALTENLEEQIHSNQMVSTENAQREQEVDKQKSAIVLITRDVERQVKLRDATAKKIGEWETKKVDAEAAKEDLKGQIAQIVNIEIVAERKEGEAVRKQIDDLLREREILNKKLVKAGDKTRQTHDLVKIQENTKKNLENEINGYRAGVKRQRDMIQQLVADRERYEGEAETANQKYYTALEEVKLQELQISALQKKIVEGETRLKQQQNLYEQVRSDRNYYSKNLIESTDEISDMKRKFKIMNHQIEQLKEEITAKDHALVKEHFDHHKVDKEKEGLKNELTRIRKQIQSSEQIIANQEAEVLKLSAIIQEADAEKTRQHKEYEAVINERDILGSQLIRRTEELAALYEKIKIQKSTLTKGEVQYEERMAEIVLLRERWQEMAAERRISQAQIANVDELRNEVYQLQRELLQERTKIKALSEELERPLNVHRWRKLEGSDPQRFDMIRKIQALQRRLINKTEEVIEKDLLIQEKEKLYIELKNILARQPGPEVAEQLSVYQQNLKEKQRQMKAMNSELEMYKSQLNEYKNDIEYLSGAMSSIKAEWFDQMRSKQAEGQLDGYEDGM
jgi:chromosome segregation ATPase